MSQNKIDLDQAAEHYTLELKSVEHPEERQSRIRKEEADAQHERWKATIFYAVGIVVTLVVGGLGLWAALDPSWPEAQQRFGTTVVSAILSGVVGFLVGKRSN